MMSIIDKLLNEEVEELLKSKNELLQGELKDFYDVSKARSGDKANMMQKYNSY